MSVVQRSGLITAFVCLYLAAAVLPAWTQQPINDGKFFCTGEFAGGVAPDKNNNKWHGSIFRADGRFVVALKYERSRPMENVPSFMQHDYAITVTEAGSSTPSKCFSHGAAELVTIWTPKNISCRSIMYEFWFNFEMNRFLKTFISGYVDGSTDTPMIEGGTCTKIE
jgi:hypothetical protein